MRTLQIYLFALVTMLAACGNDTSPVANVATTDDGDNNNDEGKDDAACDDNDRDGVCDTADICAGFDDAVDTDGDEIPDGCDLCHGNNADGDADNDGVCGVMKPDESPAVIATTPGEATTGVTAGTHISVTFSEPMAPASLTVNTTDETCAGSIQVSHDEFSECVPMLTPPSSTDGLTFSLIPAIDLESAKTYKIRVTSTASDAGGTAMAGYYTSATGFTTRYFHTIAIDGANDFSPDEAFPSSTLGHTGYIAWDDTYLYLGMDSPDLGANSSQVWFVAYLGGAPGATAGLLYNTQQPLLPFEARWHLCWRASDDFGGALEWNGSSSSEPGFGPAAGGEDVATAGPFVEMRLAWSDLGAPDRFQVHLGMLREQAFNEVSWAAVPAGSYVDGYDPNYTGYYEFYRRAATQPIDYSPK